MDPSTAQADFHVLIVGAGSAGLLIAHRLKKIGIKCTVFEREQYLNERGRDWSFGIYWAQEPLAECLPETNLAKMPTCYADEHRPSSPDDVIPIFNSATGEQLSRIPTPNSLRLQRIKFRSVLAEGIDIQFGKRLAKVSDDDEKGLVTVTFEDGSNATGNLLIGADGARSRVRDYLLGPEKGALQSLPLMGVSIVTELPGDVSKAVRTKLHDLLFLGIHPTGVITFCALNNAPDPERPETWRYMLTMTWRDEGDAPTLDAADARAKWDAACEKLAEPIRSTFESIPKNARLWIDRLAQWPTLPWDNRKGRVTLVGDAAHPMTYHRGQGLNNAVRDSINICRTIEEHRNGAPLHEVISAYDAEVVERGNIAVVSSTKNSLMLHDWDQLMHSPLMTTGLTRDQKN